MIPLDLLALLSIGLASAGLPDQGIDGDGPSRNAGPDLPAVVDPSPDTVPRGTYGDGAVRRLVERGREARRREASEIESYEARVWERVYVGLSGSRFRRERGLFEQERAARVRWESNGRRVVRWEGAYQAVPIAGLRSDRDPEMAESLVERLGNLSGGDSGPFFYDPGRDRIRYGAGSSEWALHPLADTADHHYRYRSGDTLRIRLPPGDRTVTLAEVVVEPRRADYRLVGGSLWLDDGSGELVRAVYRPARPFNLGTDLEDEPPRFLRNIEAEVRQISVDYSFHELRWWLPRRFALSLEVRVGGAVRVPAIVEWTVGEYRLNEAEAPELDLDPPPPGWTRTESMVPARSREGEGEPADSVPLIGLVPPADSLHRSPALLSRDGVAVVGGEARVFEAAELEGVRRELEGIVPSTAAFRPRLHWGLADGLVRFNRIEGLSVGVGGTTPLTGRYSGLAEIRLGSAELAPRGELRLRRGGRDRGEALAVYRRLAHASDWEDPLNLPASLSSLTTGRDRGQYFDARGVELEVRRSGGRGEAGLRLFGERHRTVIRNTDFHFTGLFGGDTLSANLEAGEGTWYGGSVSVRGHRGLDPGGIRFFGGLAAESAWSGSDAYRRVWASGGATRPVGPLDTAVEVGAGGIWGEAPPQRAFFLGGPATVRGVRPGALVGEGYWFARGEVARGGAALRTALFGDLGWAGPREAFGSGRPVRSLGAGVSVLDGLVRLDLARRLGADAGWRVHLYLDGLF